MIEFKVTTNNIEHEFQNICNMCNIGSEIVVDVTKFTTHEFKELYIKLKNIGFSPKFFKIDDDGNERIHLIRTKRKLSNKSLDKFVVIEADLGFH